MIKISLFLLHKKVFPYEYRNDWEKFNETSIPGKDDFYSNLNMEDITSSDYAHANRVCNDFEIKNLGGYHDLYDQCDTLHDTLLNLRTLEIYELDPAKFPSAPRLAWQAALKKTKIKFGLSTDINMLLMIEKGIREGICHSI